MSINTNRVGDYAEHKSVLWLMEQGWEVFRNVSCSGPVDLVGIDPDGNTVLIDVKSVVLTKDNKEVSGGRGRSPLQQDLGVCIIKYDSRTDTCEFVRHRDGTGYRHRNESGAQQDLALSF